MHLRRIAAPIVAMACAFVPVSATSAGAAGATTFSLSTSPVKVGATPYRMSMRIYQNPDGSNGLAVSLTRSASAGNHPQQVHTYIFRLKRSAFSCAPTLSTCSVDTGTSMGRYGKVNMDFVPTAAITTKKNRCSDGTLSSTEKHRAGHVSGPFTLHTFNPFFGSGKGTLTNAGAGKIPDRIPANAEKLVFFTTCTTCTTGYGAFANASNPDGSAFNLFATKPLGTAGAASITLTFGESGSATSPAFISHSVIVSGPSSGFVVNFPSSASVDGSIGAPFLSGQLSLAQNGNVMPGSGSCKSDSVTMTASGSLSAKWDGVGTETMTDPAFSSLRKTTKQ